MQKKRCGLTCQDWTEAEVKARALQYQVGEERPKAEAG